ncbi:MAG: hypothetical protein WED09_00360 [Homoserinimonas sp.]
MAVLVLYFIKLDDANTRIDDQQRQLQEQQELIEKKETFGTAMQDLMDTAGEFNGVLLTSIVPVGRYQVLASRAWGDRWDPRALDRDIADVRAESKDLEDLLSDASAELGTNSSGSTYEAVIDRLGGGYIASVVGDIDTLCEADVLGCVISNDPLTVNFNADENSAPYMSDWLRTGVAYHEYAHVLQLMNPEATEIALESFEGDDETMADCFSLTYLDGWTLDHRIWMNAYDYWDVDIGYGHTCNDVQRQAVRDWYGQLGFQLSPITQRA